MGTFENVILDGLDQERFVDVDILRDFEHAVNVMGFDAKSRFEFLDAYERLGIQLVSVYVLDYIGTNRSDLSTDDRNKQSYDRVAELWEVLEIKAVCGKWKAFVENLMSEGTGSILEKLAKEFTYKLHRTNQQTAIGYMLYVLGEMDLVVKQQMQALYGEDGYYRFAFI